MTTIAENEESGNGGQQVKTAEAISSLLQDRKDAGTDLQNATVLAALTTVYTGDPYATNTKIVTISCPERQILLGELESLAKARAVDEFTRNAGLLLEFFQEHQCQK